MKSADSTSIRWGLFPWFRERGTDMIHPEDVDAFISLEPYGKVFKATGVDACYLVLIYGTRTYRVMPHLFVEVPQPAHQIGDVVEFESGGKAVQGIVNDVLWHHKKSEPMYFVSRDGKRLSKRYWGTDFLRSMSGGR